MVIFFGVYVGVYVLVLIGYIIYIIGYNVYKIGCVVYKKRKRQKELSLFPSARIAGKTNLLRNREQRKAK